jgi:hypothetical protein
LAVRVAPNQQPRRAVPSGSGAQAANALGEAQRALEAFERSRQLGARDQIAVVNIEDIRRTVPVPK